MHNKAKEDLFDAILTTAFNEYWDRELAKMPSDEELKKMYPVPKKGLRMAKRLEKERKYKKPLAIVYLQRACVIVLIAIAAFFALLTTSPTIRAAISDSFTAWFEDHLVIDFTKDPVPPVPEVINDSETSDSSADTEPATVQSLKIGYIPKGFELVSEEVTENTRNYMYVSEDGYVMITITDADVSNVAVDNELNDYDKININNHNAYLLYNTNDNVGTLVIGDNNYFITINGVISKEQLIKIAKNIA